jgi:hypothetical protein
MKFVIPLFCLIFGLMTLKEGGAVLFVDGADRQAAGHYVPWVLWFNFLTGFALLVASGGFWFRRYWTRRLTITVATLSFMILIGFLGLVITGGAYETRTLVAMPLRTAIWTGLAFYAARALHKTHPGFQITTHQ